MWVVSGAESGTGIQTGAAWVIKMHKGGWLTLLGLEEEDRRLETWSTLMRCWLTAESRLELGYMRDDMLASSKLGRAPV